MLKVNVLVFCVSPNVFMIKLLLSLLSVMLIASLAVCDIVFYIPKPLNKNSKMLLLFGLICKQKYFASYGNALEWPRWANLIGAPVVLPSYTPLNNHWLSR